MHNIFVIFKILILFVVCLLKGVAFANISPISGVNNEVVKSSNEEESWKNYNLQFFGENLFKGNFSKQDFNGISPDYRISIDDLIDVNFWGAFNLEKTVKVDTTGNIFLPQVGKVSVAGIANKDLNSHLQKAISKTFNKNVQVYASLATSNKIRVFVSGFAINPGLYEGLPFSSIIYFIDKAGGVDPEKGSYIEVSLIRNNQIIKTFNLYDFITEGNIVQAQLHDGDSIHIANRNRYVSVVGEVLHQNKFEIKDFITGEKLSSLAVPTAHANRVTVVTNKEGKIIASTFTLQEFKKIKLMPEDRVEFLSQKKMQTISISIKGEHDGEDTVIIPYGNSLADVLKSVNFTNLSSNNNIILYRKSAAKRQKEMYNKVLDNLEQKMLNYSPISVEEAQIHKEEIKFLKDFIEKARNYIPNGLLTIYNKKGELSNPEMIILEDEDILFVPKISNFVSTFGYVANPSFIPYEASMTVKNYIELSGGLLDKANKDEIYIRKVNGAMEKISLSYKPKPGEEIIVMPVMAFKTFQFSKDVLQAIYQMAVTIRILWLL